MLAASSPHNFLSVLSRERCTVWAAAKTLKAPICRTICLMLSHGRTTRYCWLYQPRLSARKTVAAFAMSAVKDSLTFLMITLTSVRLIRAGKRCGDWTPSRGRSLVTCRTQWRYQSKNSRTHAPTNGARSIAPPCRLSTDAHHVVHLPSRIVSVQPAEITAVARYSATLSRALI